MTTLEKFLNGKVIQDNAFFLQITKIKANNDFLSKDSAIISSTFEYFYKYTNAGYTLYGSVNVFARTDFSEELKKKFQEIGLYFNEYENTI